MKVLVTGAKGFVGKNLCAQLNNIKDGKVKCYGNLTISEVYEYDIDSTPEDLDAWCKDCNFVFNLAGVKGVHGRQLRFCYSSLEYSQEVQEQLSCYDQQFYPSYSCRSLRYFGIWQEQEGWRGAHVPVWQRDWCQGIGLSLPESLWQVVTA